MKPRFYFRFLGSLPSKFSTFLLSLETIIHQPEKFGMPLYRRTSPLLGITTTKSITEFGKLDNNSKKIKEKHNKNIFMAYFH